MEGVRGRGSLGQLHYLGRVHGGEVRHGVARIGVGGLQTFAYEAVKH